MTIFGKFKPSLEIVCTLQRINMVGSSPKPEYLVTVGGKVVGETLWPFQIAMLIDQLSPSYNLEVIYN